MDHSRLYEKTKKTGRKDRITVDPEEYNILTGEPVHSIPRKGAEPTADTAPTSTKDMMAQHSMAAKNGEANQKREAEQELTTNRMMTNPKPKMNNFMLNDSASQSAQEEKPSRGPKVTVVQATGASKEGKHAGAKPRGGSNSRAKESKYRQRREGGNAMVAYGETEGHHHGEAKSSNAVDRRKTSGYPKSRRVRRERRVYKKGDNRKIHYPKGIQVFEAKQKRRAARMDKIKDKWFVKQQGKLVDETTADPNTRQRPNSWMASLTGLPPFMHYGAKNTRPIAGGFGYGNYMVSHNKAPEAPPNVPQTPQVYSVVRKSINKPKLLRKFIQNKDLPLQIENKRKQLLLQQKAQNTRRAITSDGLHPGFSSSLSRSMKAGGLQLLEDGERFE